MHEDSDKLLFTCNVLITRVVWKAFSKSAKQKMTFSPGFFSLGMSLTDLNPGKGRKISERSHKEYERFTSNFSFGCIKGNPFDIDCVGGYLGNGHDVGSKQIRDFRECLLILYRRILGRIERRCNQHGILSGRNDVRLLRLGQQLTIFK